jgi:murein L,D-transpeptidase YcbB/YkuD
MRFQARNGLEADGKLGKQTLAALNTTAAQRISQIVANMERWRWLPRPFEQRYIEVNAADATLKAVDGGNVTLTSRIVAGKPATPTPIFAATVTGVTVNPSWNIPPIIARHELLPKERRHPGYLASQHILFDGPDGMLRQQPGAGNSLGRVKLEMPNRFNSYLHDTPARTLFARTDRHFSHGCMRVEQIEPLASWALTGDASAALDRIAAAITAGDTSRISLDRPLPVYVLYWTAIANPDGTVETRPDVYWRDTKLLAALAGQHVVGRSAMNTNCPVSSAG